MNDSRVYSHNQEMLSSSGIDLSGVMNFAAFLAGLNPNEFKNQFSLRNFMDYIYSIE